MIHADSVRIKVLFELSGEHPTLPLAELLSCAKAESPHMDLHSSGPGHAIVLMDRKAVPKVASRLALCHRYGEYIGTWDDSKTAIEPDLPPGSLAVRVRSYQRQLSGKETETLTRKLAERYAGQRKIDLVHPEVELRAFASDEVHIYLKQGEIDRKQFEERAVKERPFFSPISLHPRYARALVNLTGLRSGQSLLDPFCGTGGVLLEAALLGLKVYGSDLSEEMIEGCRTNMRHFSLKAERLQVLDIGEVKSVFEIVDGVASDPPYGRSTSTNKEALGPLYERSMLSMRDVIKNEGRMAVVFPRKMIAPAGLELVESYEQRVHRSLTRHYHVFFKRC